MWAVLRCETHSNRSTAEPEHHFKNTKPIALRVHLIKKNKKLNKKTVVFSDFVKNSLSTRLTESIELWNQVDPKLGRDNT